MNVEPLNPVPVDDTTRPDPQVVDLTRRRIERNRRELNERDRKRQQQWPDRDPPEAA